MSKAFKKLSWRPDVPGYSVDNQVKVVAKERALDITISADEADHHKEKMVIFLLIVLSSIMRKCQPLRMSLRFLPMKVSSQAPSTITLT